MPCLAAPKLPYPPGLSLLLPTLSLSIPSVGITFCCKFATPSVLIGVLPLGAILPGAAAILQPVISVIMALVDLINSLIDLLQFSCPLD